MFQILRLPLPFSSIACIKLIPVIFSCYCLLLSESSFGQNAPKDPSNYAAISAGSMFFWDDVCAKSGFNKGADAMRSALLVGTNTRLHESFWEGFLKARSLQQNSTPSFFVYGKNEWVPMKISINEKDCENIRQGVIKILAPFIAEKIKNDNEKSK